LEAAQQIKDLMAVLRIRLQTLAAVVEALVKQVELMGFRKEEME
jgi:DNA-directed RNA polymerase specialized sigma54-like protein